jgi:arylsulfatase A-like enzyme
MDPNVLLVVLDSVRARNTSLHGHVNETTPFVESFAKEATTYWQARTPGVDSVSSHASLFTGLHVDEHGMTDHQASIRPGHTVWESLADEEGYDTGVFSANPFITEIPDGLKQAFDTIEGPRDAVFPDAAHPRTFRNRTDDYSYRAYLHHCLAGDAPVRSMINGVAFKWRNRFPGFTLSAFEPDQSADAYVDAFLEWEDDRTGPWAACVNLMDAHYPYEPAPEYDKWASDPIRKIHEEVGEQLLYEYVDGRRPWWELRASESLYDGTIYQSDQQVQRLVETLKRRGVLEETFLVITADHGDAFGEQSRLAPDERRVGHGVGIHEVLTHVPLVAKFPTQDCAAKYGDIATLTNFPEAVRAAIDGEWDSAEFLADDRALVTGTGVSDPAETVPSYCDDLSQFVGPWRAVYENGDDGTVKKYVRQKSNAKTIDVRDAHVSYVVDDGDEGIVEDAFESVSSAAVQPDSAETDVSSSTEQRLEDLGYI